MDHQKAREPAAPPEQGPERPPRGPPSGRRGDMWSGVAVAFVRLSLLLIGAALLVSGVSGMGSETGYADFRPVTDTRVIDMLVAPGHKSEYTVHVALDPRGEDLAVDHGQQAAYVVVPTMGDGEPRYGIKISVVRLDPEMEPLVMHATPERGAQTVLPRDDDGVRQEFAVFPIESAGSHRFVFSGDKNGELKVHMSIAGAGTLGDVFYGDFDWVQIVAGVLLVSLAASSVFSLRSRAAGRPLAMAPTGDDEDLVVHDRARVLDREDGTYARIGFARTSLTSGEEDARTPDRLARAKGKGWVIRLD